MCQRLLIFLSLSLSLLQGVAARLGVDWSVAKKWAPLAKDWKSLHACSLIWHGFWNHLSLGNWDGWRSLSPFSWYAVLSVPVRAMLFDCETSSNLLNYQCTSVYIQMLTCFARFPSNRTWFSKWISTFFSAAWYGYWGWRMQVKSSCWKCTARHIPVIDLFGCFKRHWAPSSFLMHPFQMFLHLPVPTLLANSAHLYLLIVAALGLVCISVWACRRTQSQPCAVRMRLETALQRCIYIYNIYNIYILYIIL